LLTLAKEADSVELKLTVPDADRRTTITALGIDPLEAQIRQVFFFDTPDLVLNQHGVVVRARRIQGRRGGDSVIKLRPVVPHELPEEYRRSGSLVVEVDAMPGGYVCSASMRGTLGPTDVQEVMAGGRGIRKLYSKEQRAFYKTYAPADVSLDDLAILGPITLLKVKFEPEDYHRRLVAELWFYPDGSRILELSTKCLPGEGFQTAAELRAFLAGRGVNLSGEQQTKTKAALEYFSRELETAETA
jgi:hypothetical protein